MKDYDTANNTDDNIPLQEDEDTAEVMRIAEELKRIQEEEDEEEGRGWDGSEAELVEDDDRAARVSMLDAYPELKALYDADDGNTQVFYFKNATATLSSFTKPQEVVKF